MPQTEFEARRRLVTDQFASLKVDALLISHLPNVRYLTGFTGSNGLVLLLESEALFFTDPRYGVQSRQEVGPESRICKGPLISHVAAAVKRRNIRRLGFEKSRLSYESYETLKSKVPMRASLEPVAGVVEKLRMQKSEQEIALIRRSVKTCAQAFENVAARIRPAMRESEVAAEIDYQMRKLGAEKPAFDTIVASGTRSALPHARASRRRIENGGFVLVDMGAMQEGYASDMTRMLFFGHPDQKARSLYNAVLQAQLAAIEAVRPGVTAAYVDRAARQVLKLHGFERAFVHSTGHGLGLEIHEPPRLGRKEKVRLAEGMVITVEPGAYLEDFAGVRIEDTVVVTAHGHEVLTPVSKELRELSV